MKKRFVEILEPAIMSTCMCFFMSLIMTWVHLGFGDHYLLACLKAFLHGIIVAIPVGILIGPVVHRWLDKIPKE